MTTTNDKLRSLFLAALMVFSVFAMTVALPGSAAANHDNFGDVDADEHLTSGERYWGQTILVFDNSTTPSDYELWKSATSDESAEFQRTLSLSDDGVATFSTDGLNGAYHIRDASGTDVVQVDSSGQLVSDGTEDDANFSVTTQTLDVGFEDSDVTDEDEDVELTVDTNRGAHAVEVTADGLDGNDLRDIFTDYEDRQGDFDNYSVDDDTLILNETTSGNYNTNFSGVSTGEYTFDFEAADTEASSSASINVSDAAEGDIQFADDVPQDQVGDVADITLEMDNTDEGTVTIGSADQNYWIVAHVTDDDEDGEVTLNFNTYTAGTSGNNDVLTAADSDDGSVEVQFEGGDFTTESDDTDANADLLDATEYDMNVSAGHNYDDSDGPGEQSDAYHDANEVGALSLQDRSTDNATIVTAPSSFSDWDNADTINAGMGSNVTQDDEVAQNDWAIVQIEASGLEGLYESLDNDNNLVEFLDANGATNLTIEEADPGANRDAESLTWADEEYNVVSDADNDTYYVAVSTDSDDTELFEEEDYTAEFSVFDEMGDDGDDNVLNFDGDDESETVSSDFAVIEGESELNTNDDDMILVEAADNQTVSGTSTWAPGTELRIEISSDDSTSPFLTRPEAEVQPDGTFNTTADFSELGEGTNLTLSIRGESDDYDGQVVAEGELGGETETETETETVTETETDTETDTEAPDTETDTEEPDTETDTPTDDSGPGFTVIAALGALIAAALLAVRRNN